MSSPTLGQLLFSFFEDHLKCQKGLRPSSIKSYRDTMKLFLQFAAEDAHQRLSRLSVAELTCERVRSFLKALEDKRHNHVRTRNQRLAALRTFFEYVAQRLPEALKEAGRIAAIPTKRAAPPETRFLERDEIEALFRLLPPSGGAGLRDRALLLFLYNTGARVQEVAELCVKNLELGPAPRVHLHGKGDNANLSVMEGTAQLLQKLLADHPTSNAQGPVFASAQGRPLTRFGIYKIVCRHTRKLPQLQTGHGHRAISPHVFRHYLPFRIVSCTGTPALYLRQNSRSDSDIFFKSFASPHAGKGVFREVYHRQPSSSVVSAGRPSCSTCSIYRPFARSLSERRYTLGARFSDRLLAFLNSL